MPLLQQIERTFGDHLIPDDDPGTLYDNSQLSRTLLRALDWAEQSFRSAWTFAKGQLECLPRRLRPPPYQPTEALDPARARLYGRACLNLVLGARCGFMGC